MGIIGLLVGGVFWTLAATGALDEGETAVFDVESGDCVNFDFDLETVEEVRVVEVVDCDEEHEAEVIRVGELNPEGDRPYPSDDALVAEASSECGSDEPSNLFTVVPNEDGWDDDDGPFVCFELSDA
jgi:hypothetical protein